MSGFLAHGTWVDDLGVPLLVALVFATGVIRASAGERRGDGACPYCDAPPGEEVLEAPRRGAEEAAPTARCGRCGFRLGTRLSATGATAAGTARTTEGAE